MKNNHGIELPGRAAIAAYSFVGREYWLAGATRSLLKAGSEDPRGRLFCSHLVAESFTQAGIEIISPEKSPRFVTPADISSSPLFDDITDSVVYAPEASELRGIVRLLDGDDPVTPQTEFRNAIASILSRARPVFDRASAQIPTSLHHGIAIVLTLQNRGKQRVLDEEFAEILEDAGYSDLPANVLFRQPATVHDEQSVRARSIFEIESFIASHRTMLDEWIASNALRLQGVEETRLRYGDNVPFKVLAIQCRHEHCHLHAMLPHMRALQLTLALMESVRNEWRAQAK